MEKIPTSYGTDFCGRYGGTRKRMGHRNLLPDNQSDPSGQKLMPPNGVYVTVSNLEKRISGNYQCGISLQSVRFIGVGNLSFDCKEDLYGDAVVFSSIPEAGTKFTSFGGTQGTARKGCMKTGIFSKISSKIKRGLHAACLCYTSQGVI
ncbi:MAG: hypothetical protein ACLVB1_04905 [Blautia obeum]